jgi:NAD+ synthase (glutamine-hydrolysing)
MPEETCYAKMLRRSWPKIIDEMNEDEEDDSIKSFPYQAEVEKNLTLPMEEVFEGFRSHLRMMRYNRGFSPEKYLRLKIQAINNFFSTHDLDSAVIDITDGVDSALVLAMLVEASSSPDSPIKKIVALSLPVYCTSTVDQQKLIENSRSVMATYQRDNSVYTHETKKWLDTHPDLLAYREYDLTTPFIEYTKHADIEGGTAGREKLANMVRTPMLYYIVSGLAETGHQSIVVGSMNRDEGSYVGFFAKAADAMVDLQPIADIHKSEVKRMAELLEIPKDVWYDDGRTESIIGAPYWFLEMYILVRETREFYLLRNAKLKPEEREASDKFTQNIEDIHNRNAHKYEVGLPSHFIDVIPRKVFGGWQ